MKEKPDGNGRVRQSKLFTFATETQYFVRLIVLVPVPIFVDETNTAAHSDAEINRITSR